MFDFFSHNPFVEGITGILIIFGVSVYLVIALGSSFAIALDAERRNLSKWGIFALVLLFFPVGAIVWLFVRNRFEETPMFNYATAEILAKQSGRPRSAPLKTSEGDVPEKRKIRIIEEEDYEDTEESSSRRRRGSSSSRSSHGSRRRGSSNRCRKCGHRVSSTVAACPRCGTKRSSE